MLEAAANMESETEAIAQFRLCGTWLGVPAHQVEVVGVLGSVTPLPSVPKHIRGLTEVEGQVFTLFDLASFLGMSDFLDDAPGPQDNSRVFVLQGGGCAAAVRVSATGRMAHLTKGELKPADVLSNGRLTDYLTAEFDSKLGRVGVLDVALLLESARV